MKHTTLSRFASLAASAALALSLAACGSTSRSTYSAAVSNDTAALSSQDAGDYEYYSAESAAAGESSSFSSDDLTSSMLDPSTVESSRKIVYNASVRMETTDYDTTRAALQEMARTWAGEYHTTFAPGAEAALLDRCGDDQFLLQNEIAKLAALSGYTTITTQMIQQLGTVTLDADTFDMVKLVAAGNTRQALAKLQTLLELQNEPILITGALIGNYLDIYRAFLAKKSRRPLADLAKDFKYTGKWNYRLGNADQTAARFQRSQIEESLRILQKLDLDLKGSRLDAPLLMQKAICELSLARSRA